MRSATPVCGLILVAAGVALAPAATAQQQEAAQEVFTPTLFVLASHSNNEYRTTQSPVAASSLYTELGLPFVFRGPRWNGGFSLNPAWRKYGDLEEPDQLETSINGWAYGNLSPRTSMRLVAAGIYSPQLTALDGPDIIAPRSRRLRSRAKVGLRHALNAAGDAIDIEADFAGLQYLDEDFPSQRSFGLQAGFDKAFGTRFYGSFGGRVDRIQYDDGSWVNSATPLIGFSYRLARRTELTMRGGVSFSQRGGQLTGIDRLPAPVTDELRQTIAFVGKLRHSGQHSSVTFDASRQIGSGVALGEPTIRSEVIGSYGYQQGRFRFGLTAGVAFNELLDAAGGAILLTSEGLVVTNATEVRTVASCIDAAYRLSNWMSLVVAGRVGKQLPTGAPDALELDVYRVSVGMALHPRAPRVGTASDAEILTRYGRAGSIGTC